MDADRQRAPGAPAGLPRRALLIGIDTYPAGITPLRTAANDARAVAALLAGQHGHTVRCLLNGEATASAILAELTEAAGALPEAAGFLLYFAGHGVALGDGRDGPQGYLLAADARAGDETTWLSMGPLREVIERFACRHLLVVLDCCFAGSFRWSSTRDAMLVGHPLYDSQYARFLDGEAWLALTSAAHDQRAADALPGRRDTRGDATADAHSPFAAALLDGLAGAADTTRAGHAPDGVITATELYQFLFDRLASADSGLQQTPGLWPLRPSNRGDYIFLNPSAALATLPDPPFDEANTPWLGLRAYEAGDAGLFFGRRRVVAALLARVSATPAPSLLAVVGASGTGKSSVVKAGLLPALVAGLGGRQRWSIVQAPRLDGDPAAQLATLLPTLAADGGGRVLLLIDQFEELYTQCHDASARERFLHALDDLLGGPRPPLLVLTLRSDFEPRLAASRFLGPRLAASRYLVPGFGSDELREVIDAPLRCKALYLEPPGLADTLIDEVAAMPGALPMLSFALAEMYRNAQQRRRLQGSTDRALTLADYHATGGVVGALHQRASALHAASTPAEQRAIERLFLRMVSQEGARLTRRRVALAELAAVDPAEQTRVSRVIDRYVAARLLVIDEGHVEPAHDSLVVAWEQLQEWLAASPHQALLRALWRDACDWSDGGRVSGLLWRDDPRLPQVLAIRAQLNPLEHDFVRASERQRQRRRRILVGATAASMAVLLAITAFALDRAAEATRQAGIAEAQTAVAAAQLQQAQYSEGRALLALANQHIEYQNFFGAASDAAEAISYRHFGIAADAAASAANHGIPRRIVPGQADYPRAIATLTRATLASLRPVAWGPLGFATVGADGAVLAGRAADGGLLLHDFRAARSHRLPEPTGALQRLALSPDGRLLAAASRLDDRRWQITLWDGGSGWQQAMPLTLAQPDDGEVHTLTFDGGSQRLAAASDRELRLWHLDAPLPRAHHVRLAPPTAPRRSHFAFAPDGRTMLSAGRHNQLFRYPLPRGDPGELTPLLRGEPIGPDWSRWSENLILGDQVTGLAFAPDGARLFMSSANQLLAASVDGADLVFADAPLYEGQLEIHAIALSADGALLAVRDSDFIDLLRMPTAQKSGVLWPLTFDTSEITALQFFDAGRLLLLSGTEHMQIVDVSGVGDHHIVGDGRGTEALPERPGTATALRGLIAAGRLDPLRLAFPAPATAPPGLRWELDDAADGLRIRFLQPHHPDHPERGSLHLRMHPRGLAQVAVGIDRFDAITLRETDAATLELVDIASQELVFVLELRDEVWGIEDLRYAEDGEHLQLRITAFDGAPLADYALPTLLPDMLRYAKPARCQAPFNLPDRHWLMQTRLLDCTE
jgi:hypothetical protein